MWDYARGFAYIHVYTDVYRSAGRVMCGQRE